MLRNTKDDMLHAILRQMQARLHVAYLEALAKGFDRPVILVLDLRDDQARAIAWRNSGHLPIEAMVALARCLGKRPNLVTALDRAAAIEALAADSPRLASILVAPVPFGVFRAVVIAHGEGLVAEVDPSAPTASARPNSIGSPR